MNIRTVILLLFLLLAPVRLLAWGFDVATVEALIQDHKDVRAKMEVRAVVEEGNALLHSWTNDTIKGYKKVNDLLDKYDHYFEILDLILRGAQLVVNVHQYYNNIDSRLEGISKLLHDFNDKCISTGRLETSDILIIEIGQEMVESTYDEVEQMLTSIGDILKYQGVTSAVGILSMPTSEMIKILDNIDNCLCRICKIVNHAYVRIRGYIMARMGPFFRRAVFRSRPVMEVATDALSRWLEASRNGSVVN